MPLRFSVKWNALSEVGSAASQRRRLDGSLTLLSRLIIYKTYKQIFTIIKQPITRPVCLTKVECELAQSC